MRDRKRRGRFVTLEQFIIDTFTRIEPDGTEHPTERPDEIGGGGTYALLGARMFLPPGRLGMIVDYTPETMPLAMSSRLAQYGPEMYAFRLRDDGDPTARAVNRYKGEERGFAFLTKNRLITPRDLKGIEFAQVPPSTIHFISYPARIEQILREMDDLRSQAGWSDWAPTILWEPDQEGLEAVRNFTRKVNVISPNHTEVFRILGIDAPDDSDIPHLRQQVERACRTLASFGPKQAAIIRAGSQGCCYSLAPGAPPEEIVVTWREPYWRPGHPESQGKVADPTGAGNAFMGGIGAALEEGRDIEEAIMWGTVAASFVIEQDGLPDLALDADGSELWNGETPLDRVETMMDRVNA